ncbi:uracil-DNA glycosylase [Zhihengliuella salsuginis]|uniref:Uracil-DNA glycosylase n=1 Tax=Zhihengliuella salsuginis TaxID=578222 RepID=A0ABQ3GJG1_9MICC|nr:uracil-DNA glycosylase [Zhihengliuella salsuginis]GHD10630.1 uracil-DNA glycosylase [Zhihengliuella salsuginis]
MQMAEDWKHALAPVADDLDAVQARIEARRAAGEAVLPAAPDVLRAFALPLAATRVVVLGQDPYPTPGHAIGLSFAVDSHVRPLPRSLGNIYAELRDDLGIAPPDHGDLSAWADQGVLLLNRVLTVAAGEAGSHRGLGWERITEAAVRAVAEHSANTGSPLVAILWGKDAQKARPLLASGEERGTTAVLASAHPSPLSARRGFFGSRPFSRADEFLRSRGAEPVDWTLPPSDPGGAVADTLF